MNDNILIQKAKEGCNNSFDKLLKARGEKLYKVAFCYVKNETLALDVVSEGTFKAYINLKKLKDNKYFDTWLMRIIINEALSILKKQKRVIHFDDYKKDIKIDSYERIEEKIDLYKALDKLKKDEKEILVLKYFADLTFTDISKAMNKSENTIKTKHYRSLEKIKSILHGG
ncbi:sigma-70 family RNA polymerase sigma factor [[Clostridium] dakarense]|uniref:sigma-70 family RNA polymerase sigma factor n=1 Tax=Faecalimicrobium dakarense TaxID=1301100 RepID=UPI0004B845E3|nr:sigma-70 family RNA polymerase sigma factor [[Clostridium] dakarense]